MLCIETDLLYQVSLVLCGLYQIAVYFSICWMCDFLQVCGVWWPLLCLALCMILHSLFAASMAWSANYNPWANVMFAMLCFGRQLVYTLQLNYFVSQLTS